MLGLKLNHVSKRGYWGELQLDEHVAVNGVDTYALKSWAHPHPSILILKRNTHM